MKLDDSLFVSKDAHERTITLGDGSEHLMHFREIDSGAFRRWQLAESSDDIAERVKAPALLISLGLCTSDGKDAITADQAGKLKPTVMNQMAKAILEVNGYAGKKSSPSAETTGSATS